MRMSLYQLISGSYNRDALIIQLTYFQMNFNDSLPETVDTFLILVGSYRRIQAGTVNFFLSGTGSKCLQPAFCKKNVKSSWILGQFSTIFKTGTVQSVF
jgi:hypothetical protein